MRHPIKVMPAHIFPPRAQCPFCKREVPSYWKMQHMEECRIRNLSGRAIRPPSKSVWTTVRKVLWP